jgi:hypothetical protein
MPETANACRARPNDREYGVCEAGPVDRAGTAD